MVGKAIIEAGSSVSESHTSAEIHSYSTSTLYTKIRDETNEVRGGSKYNSDLDPWQPPVLKRKYVSVENPYIREMLEEYSELVAKHSRKPLWKIVENGWEYTNGVKVDEWSPQLNESFVDVGAKSMSVDTAFLTLFDDGVFRVFTSNDVFIPYGNEHRQITEIYLDYPALPYLRSEANEAHYNSAPVGFLTQYADVESRKARNVTNKSVNQVTPKDQKIVERRCVVATPKPSIHNLYGKPFLIKQLEIALAKFHLRFYAMLKAHKGGVNRSVAFNEGSSKDNVKTPLIKEMRKGMLSRGLAYFMKGTKDVNSMFNIVETAIPELGFETVNKLLGEESKLSQQEIAGAPETGSLGGNAAEEMSKKDEDYRLELYTICERIIMDINYVFFGVPKEKMTDDGVLVPAYRVVFYDPEFEAEETRKEEKEQAEAEKIEAAKKEEIQNKFKESELKLRQDKLELDKKKTEANAIQEGIVFEAHSVEVTNDLYQSYRGNMFAPGMYRYPERTQEREIIYTAEEIEDYTKRPITKGYLELSHSFNQTEVVFDRNIGFFETQGFNEHGDDTIFHIRKDVDTKLRELGVIKNEKIKVSPYFNRRLNPETGKKELHVWNCAVVDPRKERSRAELSGLDTSAQSI